MDLPVDSSADFSAGLPGPAHGDRPLEIAGALRQVPPTQPPLHVLEVVGNGIIGGMERCVERLIAYLSRQRSDGHAFRFTAVVPSEGAFSDRLRLAGAEVAVVAMPEDPPWSSIQMLTSLITAERVELVHAHLPNAHVLGGMAARLAGVPVMTTIHGRQVILPDLELHRLVGSHLSVVCRQSYYHALGLGAERDRLSLDPNGVDTDAFTPGERPADGLRAQLGLAADALLVGYLGRLSPEKAPEVFVRAAAQLLHRLPDVHFAIIGDGPMKGLISQRIEQQGLSHRIHLVGSVEDVLPVHRSLDLLVSSSDSEAMPLGLMEAMSCGVPVIATRVGGVPEIVEHGGTGWLVAARDYEDMAGRLHQMLTQPELRQRLGLQARERMVSHHRLSERLDGLGERMVQLARPGAGLAVARVPRVANAGRKR